MAYDHKLSRHDRGYGYEWVKLRHIVLDRDMYLCQPCYRNGRPTPAKQVDHIIPKAQDGTDDLENLQAICNDCHKAKTQAEATGDKRMKFNDKGMPIW
jgi:5-methylcytosine-specific restriction protein A